MNKEDICKLKTTLTIPNIKGNSEKKNRKINSKLY